MTTPAPSAPVSQALPRSAGKKESKNGARSWIFLAAMFGVANMLFKLAFRNPHIALSISNAINLLDDMTSFNQLQNIFLQGSYAPVTEEHVNVPVQIVFGAVPDDVEGLFLRIGPNPISHHVSRGYHWFDGHGMLHGLRISNGIPSYTNQWINTTNYRLARKYDQNVMPQIGEFHGLIGLAKALIVAPLLKSALDLKDLEEGTANTVVYLYNNKLYAGQEASVPFEVQWTESNSVKSIGFEHFSKGMNYPATAHAKKDPEDGRLYFSSYSAVPTLPTMKFTKVYNDKVESYFSIKTRIRSFGHDMAITKNHVLVIESSNVFDGMKIVSGNFLSFDPEHKLRVGVMSKGAASENDLKWFEFDRAYGIIHSMNAWEEVNSLGQTEVVLLAPMSETFSGLNPRQPESLSHQWTLFELRMNLVTGATQLFSYDRSESIEFPNVHPLALGRQVRFGFASRFSNEKRGFDAIVKIDSEKREYSAVVELPAGYTCGEAVLIPKRAARNAALDGDQVYLAVFATHESALETEWMLFDGESMRAEPVVRIRLNGLRVPNGFHGLWVSENDLQSHMKSKH